MGCDIHMVVEKRGYGTNRPWELVNREDGSYGGRNYTLFSVLADVRNAGESSPTYIKPIARPRGLPNDVSREAKRELQDSADHSLTYLTIKEVLAYDWDRPVMTEESVDAVSAALVFAGGRPGDWYGPVWTEIVEAELKTLMSEIGFGTAAASVIYDEVLAGDVEGRGEMVQRILRERFPRLADKRCRVLYPFSLREACDNFLKWIEVSAKCCWNIYDEERRDEVRLVFGFDN